MERLTRIAALASALLLVLRGRRVPALVPLPVRAGRPVTRTAR